MRRLVLLLALLLFSSLLALSIYIYQDIPTIHRFADYHPKQSSYVYSDDGQLIGRFFIEKRRLISRESIPKHLIQAFLAAEDAHFYEHEGLDYAGIFRAFLKNLRPKAHLQGASTITQQTVKSLILGPERSYVRKIREALLARRLEQMLTKDEILTLYLNQIYFGMGNWGIEEASLYYFNKHTQDLNINEATYLAAIPKNPSRYNLQSNPQAAKQRQRYVLDRMLENNWISALQAQQASQQAIPQMPESSALASLSGSYLEYIRKQLISQLGEQKLYEQGLTIYTGLLSHMQIAAQEAMQQGLEDLSQRQGYVAPKQTLEVNQQALGMQRLKKLFEDNRQQHQKNYPEALQQQWIWDLSNLPTEQLLGPEKALPKNINLVPLALYQRLRAPVVRFDRSAHTAFVDLGSCLARLPLANMAWARRFQPTNFTPPPKDPSDSLHLGDWPLLEIIDITEQGDIEVRLLPEIQAEGALLAIDPHNRLVRAMLGSKSPPYNGFNRATQALRQPGSAFKPILYAAGLAEKIITPASVCADSPVVVIDPWTGQTWKPENYEDGRYDGNILYRQALIKSKNTCSVKLIQKLGPDKVIQLARQLGIEKSLPQNLTLALGTGELTPLELTNAITTFAAHGFYQDAIFVRKVLDDKGSILFENNQQPQQVLSEQVAYLVTHMMQSVVQAGSGRKAMLLERPLAGKTGTTQQARDVWFVGFAAQLVATVWMGFDNNNSLGNVYAANTALPTWIRFMGAALAEEPVEPFVEPADLIHMHIDPNSGFESQDRQAIHEIFLPGTQPTAKQQHLPSIFLEDREHP